MQSKHKLAYIALGCVLLNAVLLLINVRAQALKQARVTFNSDRDGNWEVYVMDADGKNPYRLTNNPAFDICPVWSPDGQRIAFASLRDGNWEVYVMDADGKSPRNLTNNSAGDEHPDWFDPAYGVSSAGKLKATWGRLKQTSNRLPYEARQRR